MRIEHLRCEQLGDWRRASADIVWEDARRAPQTIFFEAPAAFADDLAAEPHAFLVAAAVPALRHREARVRVAGRVCPRLREGLGRAMRRLSDWHAPGRRLPRIEAEAGEPPPAPGPRRRALFLSGGVDSLALLRGGGFDDALCVEGLDIYRPPRRPRSDLFERALASLAPVAREAGVALVPLRTNLRDLDAREAWVSEWLAAGTVAVAHALSRRIGRVALAASAHGDDLVPLGTHPELDPLYSSSSLEVCHEGTRERRIDKVARVAAWDPALRALRVCYDLPALRRSGSLNCGRCHKCVLTMLELVAVGRLSACPTFEADDLRPEDTNALRPTTDSSLGYYRELLAPLRESGRADLAAAVAHKLAVHEELARRRAAPWWQRLAWGGERRLARWAWERSRVDETGAPARP